MNHKEIRVKLINKNKPAFPEYSGLLPIEKQFIEKIKNNNISVLHTFEAISSINKDYNIIICNILEALEQLPRRTDIAFDFIWRAFEKALSIGVDPDDNITKQIVNYSIRFETVCATNPAINSTFISLMDIIPLQTCEYIAKLIFREYRYGKVINDQSGIIQRTIRHNSPNSLPNLHQFLHSLYEKYCLDSSSNPLAIIPPINIRNCGLVIKKYLCGNPISIASSCYSATVSDKISFTLNFLLYSFRCERTHANSISPFKSSLARMKTYAHVHYCLITNMTLLCARSLELGFCDSAEINTVTSKNITAFRLIYKTSLSK